MQTNSGQRAAAIQCAAAGLRVHPLYEVSPEGVCACWRGAQCPEKQRGKHPRLRAWQSEASSDLQTVARWWTEWPDAGIGVATGAASRVWVLDCDGNEALAWYRDRCRSDGFVPTRGARTGRGRHFWFRWPEGIVIRNAQGIAPGVDVRGEGGYVIAPPTLHRSGSRYEWLFNGAYSEAPEYAPEWLIELVKERPKPPPPPRVELPAKPTAREVRAVFRETVEHDPDVRRRIGERAGGTFRAAARPYVDDIPCPSCRRREVWLYLDGGPAVCHHRNSCTWAGPVSRLLEIT
jgi:hypothetical protein